jgi:hypothetical protein
MSTNATDAEERTDTELDARDVRALTECMSVLDEGGDVYTVVGQNGGTYTVDPLLGEHVDAGPQVAVTDGGIVDAGDDGEILTDGDDTDDGRPDACDCGDWTADAELVCWPCYRDGVEGPNPDVDE